MFRAVIPLVVISQLSCAIETSHPPHTGAIIAAQLRCEGYLCPNWALEFSRYDTVLYPNEQFEYLLEEALPLGPTSQRSFHSYTTYDDSTREMTL